MKKAILIFMAAIMIYGLFACADITQFYEDEPVSDDVESSLTEQSDASEEVSRSILSEDEYEVNYPFLKSEYIMTSKKKTGETVYVCKYYFVDGVVSGAKLMTTFDDAETASEYYKLVIEDYPDAELNRLTVTHYMADDDVYFYGYAPEKLEFALENAGYEVSFSFTLDRFYEDLSNGNED